MSLFSPARGRWGMFPSLPGSMVEGVTLTRGLATFQSPLSSLEPGAVVFASVPEREGAVHGEVSRAQFEGSQHNLALEHKRNTLFRSRLELRFPL